MEKSEDRLREVVREVVTSLIYHGRHFRPSRDASVVKKAVEYLGKLYTEKGGQHEGI